jgi:hypothetical protein
MFLQRALESIAERMAVATAAASANPDFLADPARLCEALCGTVQSPAICADTDLSTVVYGSLWASVMLCRIYSRCMYRSKDH